MAQVTIYVDPGTIAKARVEAKRKNMSLSRWITELIRQRTEDAWPDSVKRMAGAWSDFPLAEELREGLGSDSSREDL